MNSNDYIANILYESAIKEEKKDRRNKKEKHDYVIIDSIIKEVNKLGYKLKYETDLFMRDFNDKDLIPIVEKYYLKFDNLGRSEELLNMISKRGFYESIPLVVELYEKIKPKIYHQVTSCDNAFYNIKDKNSTPLFVDYLKHEDDFMRLPLTMTMLAKWQVSEAKPYFLKYLMRDNEDVAYLAIEALSYYKDSDNTIKNAILKRLESGSKELVSSSKKDLKRLEKNNK